MFSGFLIPELFCFLNYAVNPDVLLLAGRVESLLVVVELVDKFHEILALEDVERSALAIDALSSVYEVIHKF